MKGLFDLSVKLKDNYNSLHQNEENKIFLFNEDFLNFDFAKYKDSISFVLANCKTFPKELMKEIANRISCFRKGTILMTTSQNMNDFDEDWEIIDRVRRQMSWGTAMLFVQVKK